MERYEENSLSLAGAVAMGTGVMVGAGIFALTGQVAQLAGAWFPLAFVLAAAVSGLSAHSYITVSRRARPQPMLRHQTMGRPCGRR